MTDGRLSANDRNTFSNIEQNADSGNVQGALQEVRDYLNQNPNNPQLVGELTAQMERNGVLPLLMIEAFRSNVDINSEMNAYDDNHDGILSRSELVNGAGDSASILFGQLLADRLDLSETGESIAAIAVRLPQVLSEYQSFRPQMSSVELTIGLMSPIQTAQGTITLFDLIDNAHGGSRDGTVSYRDIEHFVYWAEHDPSNGWAQAILNSGLTLDDLRAFQNSYDHPPYNALRIGGNGDITVDSLLGGSGYNIETGSFSLRDQSGRISEIHYTNGTNRSFVYDRSGQLISVVQPDGASISLNQSTSVWEIDGQFFANNIVVATDGQMTVIRDGVSPNDGAPITMVDYYGLNGTATTTESRSVLSEDQLHDRANVIKDALAKENADLVTTLLASMTGADLLRLADYYRIHFGIDLERDGSVQEADRALIRASLFRVGDSDADFVSAIDQAMSLSDPARREEALRNIFSTMSSTQIAQMEQRWSDQHGGQSLGDHLFGEAINLSDGTRRSLEIYMQGTDANFTPPAGETAGDSSSFMNDQSAVRLGIIALESRNPEMFAEAMRTASPAARAYFAENGEGRNAFLGAFGSNNLRANDYVEWGELTLATIIAENANLLWTYTDRISTALINIPDDQRALYARGRELSLSSPAAASQEDQRAIDYFNELNSVLRNYAHGALAGFNEFQFAQWESQLLYGDSLINQVMSLEQTHTLGIGGTYHDRDAVMSAIESMSREDWDRLFIEDADGNYPFRDLLIQSLDVMLSDDEMSEARGIIGRMVEAHDQALESAATTDTSLTGAPAPDGYQLSLEQGQRSLPEIIAENSWDAVIGWRYEPADIINGIIDMSPEEQELYHQNAYVEGKGNYRDYIDGLIRDRLDNGPEMQLASLLLRQIAAGEEPEMGPLARVLYADLTNAPAGQVMNDIEAIFAPNTLNDENLSAAERDLIARIQRGETIEISGGILSVSIGRDYFVRLASETLVDAHVYAPFHSTFESLSRDPNHILWSMFDPNGSHTLPLDVKIRLAEGNDRQIIQAVLDASPAELRALQQAIAAPGGEYLDQILSELDEEDRQAARQILSNMLSCWDGQSALQLAPEDEIRLITLGVWEDSTRIETILSGMQPEDIVAVQATYASKYGDIHADVLTLIGADDEATYARVDRMLSTRGDFDARETFFNHMFDYLDIRSGLAANALPVVGARDTARMVFDDFAAELSELMGANMTAEQSAEFQDRMIETLSEFSDAKAAFTDQFVMAAETIVGIGCAFIPGLQVFSAKILISMFIAGGLMRVKMRDWMLGSEYDWNNQGSDFLLGGIQMAANVLGPDLIISRLPVFRNVLSGSLGNLLARGIEIADNYVDDFSHGIVNAIQAGGELSDDAARALALRCGLDESVGAAIREIVNQQISSNFSSVGRLATEILANVTTGGIAGGATGGLDAALHIPQGSDAFEAFNFVLTSAAMGAASGAGGAVLFTAGFKFVGNVFRGVRGETIIEAGEGTTVIRADGTEVHADNGVIEIQPGDRILVDGEPAALEAEPLMAADAQLRGDTKEPRPEGAANSYTPDEVISTRGNDFPSVPQQNGDPYFLRHPSDFTGEQRAAIREYLANSDYVLAIPERFERWVQQGDAVFARWGDNVRETATVIRVKNQAEDRLKYAIRQTQREMGDDWPANLTVESIMENPARFRDFLNSADAKVSSRLEARIAIVDNAIDLRRQVDELIQPRMDDLQAYIDKICDEAGLPHVRLAMTHSQDMLGGYYNGVLYLKDTFFLDGSHGTQTVLHELLHHNQQTLIIWNLADSLQMRSATPPNWRMRQLASAYKQATGFEIDFDDPLLREMLAMRNGQRLTRGEAALARDLTPTWGARFSTTEVSARLDAVNENLRALRSMYSPDAAIDPAAVQYARNYVGEHAKELIAAGYSGRDIGRWSDEQLVANVHEYLNNQASTLRQEYYSLVNQYLRQKYEWDAQMFGIMAEDSSNLLVSDVPESLPPIAPSAPGIDNPNILALLDDPDFDFTPPAGATPAELRLSRPTGRDVVAGYRDENGIWQVIRDLSEFSPEQIAAEVARLQSIYTLSKPALLDDFVIRGRRLLANWTNVSLDDLTLRNSVLNERVEQLNDMVSSFCDENNLPQLTVRVDESLRPGQAVIENGTLLIHPDSLLFPNERDLFDGLYHELTHNEQLFLIVRQLRSELGPNATVNQIRQAYETATDRSDDLSVEYVTEALNIINQRELEPLTQTQSRAALDLIHSWRDRVTFDRAVYDRAAQSIVSIDRLQSVLSGPDGLLEAQDLLADPMIWRRLVGEGLGNNQAVMNKYNTWRMLFLESGALDGNSWGDAEQARAALIEILAERRDSLNDFRAQYITRYTSKHHEWDAWIVGQLADEQLSALENGRQILDENGAEVGVNYFLADGNFEGRYFDAVVEDVPPFANSPIVQNQLGTVSVTGDNAIWHDRNGTPWFSRDGNIWSFESDEIGRGRRRISLTSIVDDRGNQFIVDSSDYIRYSRQDGNFWSAGRSNQWNADLAQQSFPNDTVWVAPDGSQWRFDRDLGLFANGDRYRFIDLNDGSKVYEFDSTRGLFTSADGATYDQGPAGRIFTRPDGSRIWQPAGGDSFSLDNSGAILKFDANSNTWVPATNLDITPELQRTISAYASGQTSIETVITAISSHFQSNGGLSNDLLLLAQSFVKNASPQERISLSGMLRASLMSATNIDHIRWLAGLSDDLSVINPELVAESIWEPINSALTDESTPFEERARMAYRIAEATYETGPAPIAPEILWPAMLQELANTRQADFDIRSTRINAIAISFAQRDPESFQRLFIEPLQSMLASRDLPSIQQRNLADWLARAERNGDFDLPGVDIRIPSLRFPTVDLGSATNTYRTQSEEILLNGDLSELIGENGNLSRLFPDILGTEDGIVGRPQHDFHDFTVDQHTLRLIEGLRQDRRFATLPLEQQVDVLWAALLHDAGKAAGVVDPNQAMKSEGMAWAVLNSLGYSDQRTLRIMDLIYFHDRYSFLDDNGILNTTQLTEDRYLNEMTVVGRSPSFLEQIRLLNTHDIDSVRAGDSLLTPDVVDSLDLIANTFVPRVAELNGRSAFPILTNEIGPGPLLRAQQMDSLFVHRPRDMASFLEQLGVVESRNFTMSVTEVTPSFDTLYHTASGEPVFVAIVSAPPEHIGGAFRHNLSTGTDRGWLDHIEYASTFAASGSEERAFMESVDAQLSAVTGMDGNPLNRQTLLERISRYDTLDALEQAVSNGTEHPSTLEGVGIVIDSLTTGAGYHNELKLNNVAVSGIGVYARGNPIYLEGASDADLIELGIDPNNVPDYIYTSNPPADAFPISRTIWQNAIDRELPIIIFDR